MPVCTIHILSLSTSLSNFLAALRSTHLKPLVTARVARWIITPTKLSKDALLSPSQSWDVLLILPSSTDSLPNQIKSLIKDQWSIKAGIPSNLIAGFDATNHRLLHPASEDVPSLTGALSHPIIAESSQALELNDELQGWIARGKGPQGAVSMLNLLAFRPGKKEEYLKYGKAFAKSIGSSRGGVAKIVGKVVPESCSDGCEEWEEIALAHYPSLQHFADMLASEDYQAVNKKHRVLSLKDTCILCTSELEVGGQEQMARL